MRKERVLIIALLACFGATVLVTAGTGDVPVTSTIKDYVDVIDAGTGAAQRLPMQIQSDGAGAYKNSTSVTSRIQGIGDWELDTGVNIKSPTRKVFLDFSKPIPASAPNGGAPVAPFTSGLVRPRFISKCSQYGVNLLTLVNGQTVRCPMTVGFYYPAGSTTHYRVHMTPDEGSVFPYPSTDYVNVTCTAANANAQCTRWHFEPNAAKGGCVTADCSVKQNVVKLVKVVTAKGQTTESDQGNFYMSFSTDVTNP
jgi:hypothetical protein